MAIDVSCSYLMLRAAQGDARRLLAAEYFVAAAAARVEGAAAQVLGGDPSDAGRAHGARGRLTRGLAPDGAGRQAGSSSGASSFVFFRVGRRRLDAVAARGAAPRRTVASASAMSSSASSAVVRVAGRRRGSS